MLHRAQSDQKRKLHPTLTLFSKPLSFSLRLGVHRLVLSRTHFHNPPSPSWPCCDISTHLDFSEDSGLILEDGEIAKLVHLRACKAKGDRVPLCHGGAFSLRTILDPTIAQPTSHHNNSHVLKKASVVFSYLIFLALLLPLEAFFLPHYLFS